MKRICVYCGSSPGRREAYRNAAVALGRTLTRRGLGLIYGGASVGIMGAIADTVLEAGGEAIGIIPEALAVKEVAHDGLTEQHVVASMHERKALMAEKADAFIALPGGWGTFEELFEVLTWAQLGFHEKPVGLLNVDGYYDRLAAFLEGAIEEGFVPPVCREMLMVEGDPDLLVERFSAYRAPTVRKWITREDET
ncbi:MAG: TIGR00730 family Rossman fold protein [Pseudomonadota bacterium]